MKRRDGLTIVLSERVAETYGGRVLAIATGARLVVPAVKDGSLVWSGEPAGADVCYMSEDFWAVPELRQHAIGALFRLEGLAWFHSFSAGTDSPAFAAIIERGTLLTNSSGASAIPIAQYVLAMMLQGAKRLPELREQQSRHEWSQLPGSELTGQTIGIIGTGAIGGEVARLAKAFRMRVIGARRSDRRTRYVDAQVPYGDLAPLLAESDYVVIACPLTDETRGMIGERELRLMKPSATLINVARGAIIDEGALIRALREGRIAGACLDVFTFEPLPEDSPLWDMPNVWVTPHNSPLSPLNAGRGIEIFLDNLQRFVSGKKLRNIVGGGTRAG